MSSQFLAALDAEIAQLTASIDDLGAKLGEAQRLRALYERDSPQRNGPQEEASSSSPRSPKGTGRRASPQAQRILDAVAAFIGSQKAPFNGAFGLRPVPTGQIAAHLQQVGIEVRGKNPRNSLSAMLSHSTRFVSHGRAGWTLAECEIDPAQRTETADHTTTEGSAASEEPRPTSEGTDVRSVNPWPGGGT